MTIAQITNDLRRKISFMERHPSKNPKSIQKLAIYRTWLLMATNLQWHIDCAQEGPTEMVYAARSQTIFKQIEKEFSK